MSADEPRARRGLRGAVSRPSRLSYWKCDACGIRVSSAELATDLIAGSSCPSCGAPLQAVRDLTKVRGFRSPGLEEARTPRSVLARVAQAMARRDAASARIKRDGARLAGRA